MSLYLTYNGQTMYSVGIDRSEFSDFFCCAAMSFSFLSVIKNPSPLIFSERRGIYSFINLFCFLLKNKIDVCGVVVAVTETRVNRFGLNDYYVFRNDKAVKRDRERRFG